MYAEVELNGNSASVVSGYAKATTGPGMGYFRDCMGNQTGVLSCNGEITLNPDGTWPAISVGQVPTQKGGPTTLTTRILPCSSAARSG